MRLQAIEDDYSHSEGELQDAEEKPNPDIELGSKLSHSCFCASPEHSMFNSSSAHNSFADVHASSFVSCCISCFVLFLMHRCVDGECTEPFACVASS